MPTASNKTIAFLIGLILATFLFLFNDVLPAFAFDNIIYQSQPADNFVKVYGSTPSNDSIKRFAIRWFAPADGIEVCGIKIQGYRDNALDFSPEIDMFVASSSAQNNPFDDADNTPITLVAKYGVYLPASASYNGYTFTEYPIDDSDSCFYTHASTFYYFVFDTYLRSVYNPLYSRTTTWHIGFSNTPLTGFSSWSEILTNPNLNEGYWRKEETMMWSFQLVNSGGGGETPLPPPPLAPNEGQYSFSNQDFGLLGNMFRDVLLWLFSPPSFVFNQFTGLWDLIKSKPPIGNLTLTLGALSDLQVASGSVDIDITGFEPVFNPFKNGLTIILWILFVLYIIKRLIHFEL